MARYEVFIPAKPGTDGDSVTVEVDASSWLLALRTGMKQIGEQGDSLGSIMCENRPDGTVVVKDPNSRRMFRIKEAVAGEVPDAVAEGEAKRKEEEEARRLREEAERKAREHEEARKALAEKIRSEKEAAEHAKAEREEAERRRKEEEERRKKEEEEKRKREKEEAARRAEEEEKLKKSEEEAAKEAIKRAEEERRKQEDEKRKKREEEEKRRQEEEIKREAKEQQRQKQVALEAAKAAKEREEAERELKRREEEAKRAKKVAAESAEGQSKEVRVTRTKVTQEEIDAQMGEIAVDEESFDVDEALSDLFMDTMDLPLMNEDDAPGFVLDLAMAKLKAEAGSVILSDINSSLSDLYFAAAVGEVADQLGDIRIPRGKGIVGFSVQYSCNLSVSDVNSNPNFYKDVAEKTGYETRSILCVPIRNEERTFGAIELVNKIDSNKWTTGEVNVIDFLAGKLAERLQRVHDEVSLDLK